MRKTTLLTIALSLALAAPAAAAPFTPTLNADFAFAARWWAYQPTGCSSLTLEVLAPDEMLNPGAAGEATQPEPVDAMPCFVHIAWEPRRSKCSTLEIVLHEYGHLLGLGHSLNPANIMAPHLPGRICWRQLVKFKRDRFLAVVRRCRAHFVRTEHEREACAWRIRERRWELEGTRRGEPHQTALAAGT